MHLTRILVVVPAVTAVAFPVTENNELAQDTTARSREYWKRHDEVARPVPDFPKRDTHFVKPVPDFPKRDNTAEPVPDFPKRDTGFVKPVPDFPKRDGTTAEPVPYFPKRDDAKADAREFPKRDTHFVKPVPDFPKRDEVAAQPVPDFPKRDSIVARPVPDFPKRDNTVAKPVADFSKRDEAVAQPVTHFPKREVAKPVPQLWKRDQPTTNAATIKMLWRRAFQQPNLPEFIDASACICGLLTVQDTLDHNGEIIQMWRCTAAVNEDISKFTHGKWFNTTLPSQDRSGVNAGRTWYGNPPYVKETYVLLYHDGGAFYELLGNDSSSALVGGDVNCTGVRDDAASAAFYASQA